MINKNYIKLLEKNEIIQILFMKLLVKELLFFRPNKG